MSSGNSQTSSARGNHKKSTTDNKTLTSSSENPKSRKRSNTDSPSWLANNSDGRNELDQRIRSVLSQPLGLALLLAFHDNVAIHNDLPLWMNYFCDCQRNTTYDKVLAESVAKWRKMKISDMTEFELTELIETTTKEIGSVLVQGRVKLQQDQTKNNQVSMDMEVETQNDNTPSLLIEVGLNNDDWFKKLHQGMKYLELMCLDVNATKNCTFKEPLLLAIVTMDKDDQEAQVDFQIGVFLCWRKDLETNNFRMSLLWQYKTDSLEHASKLFGRTLVIAKNFGMCRDNFKTVDEEKYEYLSSNCCKVQWKVGTEVCRIC